MACSELIRSLASINKSMLCAGGQADRNLCGRDSSGPIISIDLATGEECLAGIVS